MDTFEGEKNRSSWEQITSLSEGVWFADTETGRHKRCHP